MGPRQEWLAEDHWTGDEPPACTITSLMNPPHAGSASPVRMRLHPSTIPRMHGRHSVQCRAVQCGAAQCSAVRCGSAARTRTGRQVSQQAGRQAGWLAGWQAGGQ
eukprot:gene16997-biopygen12846